MGSRWGTGAVALVLAVALGGHPSATAPAGEETALERAFAAPRTTPEVRRRLAALDARELGRLLRLCATGELATDSGRLQLDAGERALARESLAARPRRELVPVLEDVAARPYDGGRTDLALRREAQELLGRMGTTEHARLLVRLTHPGTRGLAVPELRAGFSAALAAILARDPAGAAHVPALFSEAPAALSSSIVEALARQEGETPTRVLAQLLGRSPGLDPLLLARLAERGPARPSGDESVLESVRRYLRQRDPALVAAGARASARLGDDGAVEILVGLLDHPHESARASAFDALRELSGIDHGPDAARWASWYQAEMRWWDEEAEEELVHVERGRGIEFARASRAVLEHRLFRARIVEAFSEALRHAGATEARMACHALAQLGSPAAVRVLVECLEHPDPRLREVAAHALEAIPGARAGSWTALD